MLRRAANVCLFIFFGIAATSIVDYVNDKIEFDFDMRIGQQIRLQQSLTVDFDIPFVGMKVPEDNSEQKLPLPVALLFELLTFMDMESFKDFFFVSRHAAFIIKSYLKNIFEREHGFRLNVPDRLTLKAYRAFFIESPDFSGLAGLQHKVIDLDDFVALNFYCALTKIAGLNEGEEKVIFSERLPGVEGLTLKQFFNEYDPDCDADIIIPENMTVFHFLFMRVFTKIKSNKAIITSELLPYTCQALIQSCQKKHFEDFFASLSLRAQAKSISPQIIGELFDPHSLFANWETLSTFQWIAAKAFLRLLANSCKTIEEFKAFFLPILEKIYISPETNPQLIASYALYESLINRALCYDYEHILKQNPTWIRAGLYKYERCFLLYFYEVTPEEYLAPELLGLKYLLTTKAADIDYEEFFNRFGDPKAFEICFESFVYDKKELRMDILMAFIKYALSKDDFLAPKRESYSCITKIYTIDRFGPEGMQTVIKFLKENNRGISLAEICSYSRNLTFPGQAKEAYITSPFDYLLVRSDEKEFRRLLTKHNVNMRVNMLLNDFDHGNLGVGNGIYLEGRQNFVLPYLDEPKEWTLFELCVVLNQIAYAEIILGHPDFDRTELEHQIDGSNGIDLVFELFYPEKTRFDHPSLIDLKSRVNEILGLPSLNRPAQKNCTIF